MEDWKEMLKSFLKRVSGKKRFQDIADDLGVKFKTLSSYFEKDSKSMPVDFAAIVAHRYNLSETDVDHLIGIICGSHSLFVDMKKMGEQELSIWLHLSLLLSTMDDGQKKEFDGKLRAGYVSTLSTGNGLDVEGDDIPEKILEDPDVVDAWKAQSRAEELPVDLLISFIRSCLSDREILESSKNGSRRTLYDLLLRKCSELLPAVYEKRGFRKVVIGKIGDFLYYDYGKHERDKKDAQTPPEATHTDDVPNMDDHGNSSLKEIPNYEIKVDKNGQQSFAEREVPYGKE